MRKGFFAICSILLVLVVSLAVLGPSCTPTTGTIDVDATLDGSPWPSSGTGAVDYTLTGSGATAPTVIDGDTVPDTFTVDPGSWTCAYVSGGPGTFVDITTSATQSVTAGNTTTFTLNFETPEEQVDASITFVSWTIDGQQVDPGTYTVYPPSIIDCEYDVVVNGTYCESVNVTVSLKLPKHFKGPSEWQSWHVANAPGSVYAIPPGTIWSQNASMNGTVLEECTWFDVFKCVPMYYDVTFTFEAHKGTTYRTKVNWLRYSASGPDAVLFDTDFMHAGCLGSSDLVTSGCVYVPGDVNPANDYSGYSERLYVTHNYSCPPG